jgi:hypothetical protein
METLDQICSKDIREFAMCSTAVFFFIHNEYYLPETPERNNLQQHWGPLSQANVATGREELGLQIQSKTS